MLEASRVEFVRAESEQIAAGGRLDAFVPERLAETRDIDLHALGRVLRRALPPQLVDDAVGRQRLVRVDREQCKERAFTTATDIDRAAVLKRLQRPQQPKIHWEQR